MRALYNPRWAYGKVGTGRDEMMGMRQHDTAGSGGSNTNYPIVRRRVEREEEE